MRIVLPCKGVRLLAGFAMAAVLSGTGSLLAATRTWTGGGADNNWTTAANWGGTAPSAGDDLMFPGGTPRLSPNNDLAANTSFNTISFSGSSGGYTLGGNAIQLVAGISATNSAGQNTVSLALTLTAPQTFFCSIPFPDSLSISGGVALGTFTLTLNPANHSIIQKTTAAISGTGGITISGSVAITSACTYSGPTNVNGGALQILLGGALNPASVVTVGGGLLRFADGGSCGPVTLNSLASGTVTCGGGGVSQQGIVTDLTLQPPLSTLAMDMESASNYGQIQASGAVSVGGATLILFWSFTSSTGNAFTIIDKTSSGPITGTFAGLPEGAMFAENGRNYQITYAGGDGNDVVVTDIGPATTGTAVVPTLSPNFLVLFGLALAMGALFLIRRSG